MGDSLVLGGNICSPGAGVRRHVVEGMADAGTGGECHRGWRGRAAAGLMEYFFTCPYCWQRISMVLDTSVKGQTFIEDCEVCCQPIQVRYAVEDGDVNEFEATVLE